MTHVSKFKGKSYCFDKWFIHSWYFPNFPPLHRFPSFSESTELLLAVNYYDIIICQEKWQFLVSPHLFEGHDEIIMTTELLENTFNYMKLNIGTLNVLTFDLKVTKSLADDPS